MAIIDKGFFPEGITGRLGGFVIKNYKGKLVLSSRPDMQHVKATDKQKKARKRFAAAVAYAKAILNDTHKKLQYEQMKGPKETVYQLAIKEYYKLY